ncbi:MAG TPA: hypothetical protein VIM09_08450 [Chthoniobacterales bacterium]|jgi:hypothetical protein
MKPLSPITPQRRSHFNHPDLDAQYHVGEANFPAVADRLKPSPALPSRSFRDLSSEFLGTEMKRDYLAEAICFLVIVSLSAWPIVSMVRAFSLLK